MLKKIFESTILMGTSSILVMFLDIIRVKILAVLLGIEGIGTISILAQFHTLAVNIMGLGLAMGVVKYIVQYKSEGNTDKAQSVFQNAFQINLFFSCIFVIIVLFTSQLASNILLDSSEYGHLVIIYILSLPLAAYAINTQAYIRGLKLVLNLSKIDVLRVFITLLFIIPLVYFFGLTGAAISVLVGTAIQGLLNTYYLHKSTGKWCLIQFKKFDISLIYMLFLFGMTSLLVSFAQYFSELLLKIIIVNKISLRANGIYQPVWALTMSYLTLVLTSMSTYSYPRLCELRDNFDISEELNGMIRISILFITPIMFFLVIFRKIIISAMYDSSFLEASDLMPIQILGDFFKVLVWSFGMYLLPTKRFKGFIILSVSQPLMMLGIGYFLIVPFNLYGIGSAFAFSNFAAFILVMIMVKRDLNFTLWKQNLVLISSSFTFLVGLIITSFLISHYYKYGIFMIIILGWGMLSLKKKEIFQVLSLGKEYINKLNGPKKKK